MTGDAVETGLGELLTIGAGLLTAGAACTGLLLIKPVEAPKMSGSGSPRTGWLVVPTGMANGIGVCRAGYCQYLLLTTVLAINPCHNMGVMQCSDLQQTVQLVQAGSLAGT